MHDPVRQLATRLGADFLRMRLLGGAQPVLDGKFALRRLLGRGASGVVVEAWDSRLARRIALKIAPCTRESGSMADEARALAQLQRPRNVVQVHDVGRARLATPTFVVDVDYVAMELIEGPTLRSWLVEAPRLPRDVLRMYLGIADGIALIHAREIVHGDIKPDNVLVPADGTPILVDFGFASHVLNTAEGTRRDDARGTAGYMSPEARQGMVNKASDVYAFAASVWESLVGEPYSDSSSRSFWTQLTAAWRATSMPTGVHDALLVALSEHPKDRPPIDDLRRALAAEMRAMPVEFARPPTPVTTPVRPAERETRGGGGWSTVMRSVSVLAFALIMNKWVPHWTERLPDPVGGFLRAHNLRGKTWTVRLAEGAEVCGTGTHSEFVLRLTQQPGSRTDLRAELWPRFQPPRLAEYRDAGETITATVQIPRRRHGTSELEGTASEPPDASSTCRVSVELVRTRTGFESAPGAGVVVTDGEGRHSYQVQEVSRVTR